MNLLPLPLAFACLSFSASALAGERAPAEAEDLVKGFVVTGTLKQVIGNFNSYGTPGVGNTFTLDLANLPTERIQFTRQPEAGRPDSFPSYMPFSAPLHLEGVRREDPVTKPGRAAINLSTADAGPRFLVQIQADRLEKGSKVRVLFFVGALGFMGSMAEADGVLR